MWGTAIGAASIGMLLVACGAQDRAASPAQDASNPSFDSTPLIVETISPPVPLDTFSIDRTPATPVESVPEETSRAAEPGYPGGRDGPVIRHLAPMDGEYGLDAGIRGVLQLEGDCLYVLRVEGDERYPVVWPAESSWNDEQHAVITPNGDRIEIGAEIDGGGGYFYASELEPLVGPEGAELAMRCVDNTYDEVAVVNNSASAIGPDG